MFTGIIETVGQIVSTVKVSGDVRVVVSAPDFKDRVVALGDSIAINGVCLTVVEIDSESFAFDVSIESINHSLIGEWVVGTSVNLEMAMLPTTRLGGHLVSGHVDGLANLVKLEQDARSWRMFFQVPVNLSKYIAKKGSITINGVSLTVNDLGENQFDINVIPHTLEVTTLGKLKVGDQVHIEVDLIARYLERLLTGSSSDGSESAIDQSFLQSHGFA